MIWVGGRVVPDDALRVSVLDRTFEHGLGLFETLRTYGGVPSLLERHLARLARSAHELGLPLTDVERPDRQAVAALVDAQGVGHDVTLRITLSGGLGPTGGATLWMRCGPLPPPSRHEGALVDLGAWWVHAHDPFSKHKTLNYWSRRRAHESASQIGFDEVLSIGGLPGARVVWEGSRTNVFAVHGRTLITPSLDGPLVPGVMRGLVVERAPELGLELVEDRGLKLSEMAAADEVFLTNSVRGIVPVRAMVDASPGHGRWAWRAPGDWTRRLRILVDDWLGQGGRRT